MILEQKNAHQAWQQMLGACPAAQGTGLRLEWN